MERMHTNKLLLILMTYLVRQSAHEEGTFVLAIQNAVYKFRVIKNIQL